MGFISTHVSFSLHPATKYNAGQTMQTQGQKRKSKIKINKKHQLQSKQIDKVTKKMHCNKLHEWPCSEPNKYAL